MYKTLLLRYTKYSLSVLLSLLSSIIRAHHETTYLVTFTPNIALLKGHFLTFKLILCNGCTFVLVNMYSSAQRDMRTIHMMGTIIIIIVTIYFSCMHLLQSIKHGDDDNGVGKGKVKFNL